MREEVFVKYTDIYTEAPANPDTLSMLGPIAPLPVTGLVTTVWIRIHKWVAQKPNPMLNIGTLR